MKIYLIIAITLCLYMARKYILCTKDLQGANDKISELHFELTHIDRLLDNSRRNEKSLKKEIRNLKKSK